jgi:hypothetical protein
MYKRVFLEVIDLAINSLKTRFQKEVMDHISKLEAFAVGEFVLKQ